MTNNFAVTEEIKNVPIGRLLDNPLNTYLRGDSITPESVEGLAASIKENGVQVPLLVTPYRQAFYVVWGHRRKLAARLAGLTEVPCIIREMSEDAQFSTMMAENIQRENITPLAEARCYRRLEEEGKTLPAIERKTGVGKARIKNLLAVLTLEPEVQAYFETGKLALGTAPHLAKLTDRDAQLATAREAATRGWSVKKLEEKVEARVGGGAAGEGSGDDAERREGQQKRGPVPRGRLVDEAGERLTKSEALELFDPEDTFSLRDIKRAILGSCCNTCDEKLYPDICRECPLSQLLATLLDVKRVRRPARPAEGEKAADAAAPEQRREAA